MGNIECKALYPIKEGKYIIQLLEKWVFSNGDIVLPFNLTEKMFSSYYNEDSYQLLNDYRLKMYD